MSTDGREEEAEKQQRRQKRKVALFFFIRSSATNTKDEMLGGLVGAVLGRASCGTPLSGLRRIGDLGAALGKLPVARWEAGLVCCLGALCGIIQLTCNNN